MSKFFLILVAAIIIVLFQISFLNDLIFIKNFLNIVIICAVLITINISYQRGFMFSIMAGIVLDIYSPYNFGIITIALTCSVLLITNLFKKILANKSIYSQIIAMSATTISYHIIIWLIASILFWLGWSEFGPAVSERYLIIILGQVLIHIVLTAIIFTMARLISQKLRLKFFLNKNL